MSNLVNYRGFSKSRQKHLKFKFKRNINVPMRYCRTQIYNLTSSDSSGYHPCKLVNVQKLLQLIQKRCYISAISSKIKGHSIFFGNHRNYHYCPVGNTDLHTERRNETRFGFHVWSGISVMKNS